jgi:hypothetical protein
MRLIATGLLVLALVGCGSPVTSTPALGPSATGVCAPFAGIDPAHPPDTLPLTPDPVLEAEFPPTIGSDPVVDVASGGFIQTLCVMGGQASVDAARRNAPAGVNIDDLRVASATATANGLQVTINAYRLPGHGGADLVPLLNVLSQTVAPGSPRFGDVPVQTTAGGKTVSKWTDAASGAPTYVYATGDTIFVVSDISPSQADQVFAALP